MRESASLVVEVASQPKSDCHSPPFIGTRRSLCETPGMLSQKLSFALLCLLIPIFSFAQRAAWVQTDPGDTVFTLVSSTQTATLMFEDSEHSVVEIAVTDLAKDIERVTAQLPDTQNSPEGLDGPVVLVGTIGTSSWIDALAETGKIDLTSVEGQWETFLLQSVDRPLPGVEQGFVIIGSDRRGTAFGVYELSQAIGVSPWYWWADVTPRKADNLYLDGNTQVHGPPSVKYRGFFINDEDWKLHPWAMRTYDPELGDIGPKTYKRVFELMLRLKTNTLWPAMHEVTQAFNIYPENKYIAESYAIVMGSSHAEPMLRNNVTEWTAPHADYNYVTNREGVLEYWRQRVEENAAFENIYTIGMRGIHDSGMVGADSDEQRIALLEQIFEDQRALIERYVDAPLESVPQMFNPYKEVLDLYHGGLNVPDDVTIVWPNDNHGYIRYLPDERERERAGGSGIYYHISYLGAPFAYLWLYTTPPSLVWYEMNKAYDYGARDLWILNVGDMKNSEIGMDLFLQMAWDIDRWKLDTLPEFLETWAASTFGKEHARAIAEVMTDYFLWNHKRRPEHLQWYLPHTRFAQSPLSNEETRERLLAFEDMSDRAKELWQAVPEDLQDAFFQLVYYPVRGSVLANQRYFGIEQYHRFFNSNPPRARQFGAIARAAEEELNAITAYYNSDLADGKWRHFMSVEPADTMWRSYRQNPQVLPASNMVSHDPELTLRRIYAADEDRNKPADRVLPPEGNLSINAEEYQRKRGSSAADWKTVHGLGHSGHSVSIFPTRADSMYGKNLRSDAPFLEYDFEAEGSGPVKVRVQMLPTHPVKEGTGLRIAVAIGDSEPVELSIDREVGDQVWSQSVLSASIEASGEIEIPESGSQTLNLYMIDPGVVVDRIHLSW